MILRETIKNITRKHLLEDNGVLLAQNVTAVGWIQNTVPSDIPNNKGIIELPTSDASNAHIVCGFGLMNRNPIYVIRYQGFGWINYNALVNYAAKIKAISGKTCKVFVRSIGMEGGVGPTATGCNHGLLARQPGLKLFAPMSSGEWKAAWQSFIQGDDPVFCSEHRRAYTNDNEFKDNFCVIGRQPTIIAIGAARLNALEAQKILKEQHGIYVNLFHLWQLKPLVLDDSLGLASSKILVVDSDYEFGGFGNQVAIECHKRYKLDVDVMGIEDKVAGTAPHTDIMTPSIDRIVQYFLKR